MSKVITDRNACEHKKILDENVLQGFQESYEKRYEAWKDTDTFEQIVCENLPKQCSLTEMTRYIIEMKTAYREQLKKQETE